MERLKIKKIDKYNVYILQCGNRTYSFTLEFYNMPKPRVGDVLIFPKSYLDINSADFVYFLCFQPFDGTITKGINKNDIAGLCTKDKNYCLLRIYG